MPAQKRLTTSWEERIRTDAFTIQETLVVSAIVAVLSAIIFPVAESAIHEVRVNSSISNLHQMHLNIMLYQTDYNGGGTYGDLAAMGLPNIRDHAYDYEGDYNAIFGPKAIWKSPCGLDPSFADGSTVDNVKVHYIYRPEDGTGWANYSNRYEENSLLFFDVNCDDHDIPFRDPEFTHRGLGVLLSGHLVSRSKKGDMYEDKWWGTPDR